MSAYAIDFPDSNDPNFDPDAPFEAPNGITYTWNGYGWVAECGGAGLEDEFLKRRGDTVDDADERADYDWNEGVKLGTNFGGTSLVLEGSDAILQGSTSAKVSGGSGGVLINGGTDVTISPTRAVNITAAGEDITLEALSGAERINRTIDDTNIDDQIVNKRYVDEKNAFLQGEIVELEEEIEAIAPSVERGFWTMNLLGTVANQGQMSLYDDDYTNVGNPTGLFKDVKSIWLNERDNAGTSHGFAGVEAGELIELFVQGADEFGLYEVVDVHDETNGAAQWWVIEVTFVRTLEDASTTSTGDIIRVKIFNAPEGGSADEFVLKEGDDMTGRLRMDTGTAGFDTDYRKPTDRNTAFIQLKHLANTSTKLASIWQPQATEEIALGRSVHIESILYCNAWYGYVLSDAADGSGRRERTTQDPNIQFLSFNGDDRGRLKWGSNDRINWTEAGGSLFSDNDQARLSWGDEGVKLSGKLEFAIDSASDTVGSIYASSRGAINIEGVREINSGYKIEFNAPDSFTFYSEKSSPYNVFGVVTPGCITSPDSTSNFYKFLVDGKGTIWAGHNAANAFVATEDHHVATKKYVDQNSGGVEVRAGAPDAPIPLGKMWFDTTRNALYLKTGS